MQKFFYLEGGYLILAAVVLLVTLFVTTRPFMGKNAKKKGLMAVSAILAVMIGGHYWVTMDRMEKVKQAFENGDEIICESRLIRKGAQSIILKKTLGWRIEGDYFVSDAYSRPFFMARCIIYKKAQNNILKKP
ncbi:hypothetical protein [Hydrogenimonas cancrithermarum]|uniref:Uncharacterized protein n=1 Tax=Hydrogenimonas cancrithermarum TaxID=2993563 RepID=A0ABN6WX21_9BACT|nr:hypothetical protein [Hydrogenimonas cancrithermarum]BDY13638.1 hypothetical protein HCR_19500 [Hydrogenimonas cancrithermarum]